MSAILRAMPTPAPGGAAASSGAGAGSAAIAVTADLRSLSTANLLTEGGDPRIALEPLTLTNKYGCSPLPDPALLSFGSSTASTISENAFDAADRLRQRLVRNPDGAAAYRDELERMRRELLGLCELQSTDTRIVFAASGTDLLLLCSILFAGQSDAKPRVILVGAEETGSGVPAAIAGRHFSCRTALGAQVTEGGLVHGEGLADIFRVPIRHGDGNPRRREDIDAEVRSIALEAIDNGRHVLLVAVDVSKTGLIAPSADCAIALRQDFPDAVDVLVDACQFRIGPATLAAYLRRGFMVALTGSKFLTGPTFAGALCIPGPLAERLHGQPLPRALSAYSARADWPRGWRAAQMLNDVPNFGLLLRWEAALAELKAFRSMPPQAVESFLREFAEAVRRRLAEETAFEPLPLPPIDRGILTDAGGWDRIPTIFPFLLRGPNGFLRRDVTESLYRALRDDSVPRVQLGQPVACGIRDGVPMSALRICSSARLAVHALNGKGSAAVIAQALAALQKAAELASRHG